MSEKEETKSYILKEKSYSNTNKNKFCLDTITRKKKNQNIFFQQLVIYSMLPPT